MMKRRLTAILAMLSLLAMLFAGCSSAPADTAAESTEKKPANVALNDKFVDGIKEAGQLVVGCKADVPGLGFYDAENDEWSGLEVELAYKTAGLIFGVDAEEAKEKNLVEIKPVTVADREDFLTNGDIDLMLATYTITDERAQKFALSDSYYTDYIGIMVRDSGANADNNSLGSKDIRSIADLDGKYIGVPRNATTREDFLNYIETMNSVHVTPIFCEFDGYEQLFKALKNGNIDAMSVDVSILNGYVDKSTKILNDRFAGQHYGAAVLPENAGLLEFVNQAIAQ